MVSGPAWPEPGGCEAGVVIVPEPCQKPARVPHEYICVLFCLQGKPLKYTRSSGSGYLEISLQGGRIGDGNINQEAAATFKGHVIKT